MPTVTESLIFFSPNYFAEGLDLLFLVTYTVDPNSPVTLSWLYLY